jgi:hypothetical protein
MPKLRDYNPVGELDRLVAETHRIFEEQQYQVTQTLGRSRTTTYVLNNLRDAGITINAIEIQDGRTVRIWVRW